MKLAVFFFVALPAQAAGCVNLPGDPEVPRAIVVQEASVAEHPLDRVVVIGASMAAGFGLDVEFAEVLEATLAREHDPVQSRSNALFYLGPHLEGAAQIDFASSQDPTLLLAVDFLFWFGYGTNAVGGNYLSSEGERLEVLERGLALLDSFDCPLVVADFPDMSAAVDTKMLVPEMLPQPVTLVRLNARLAEWARERGDVHVVPFARMLVDMRGGKPFQFGRYRWPADSTYRVLQDDQLHPTVEGMAAILNTIAVALCARGWTTEADWELDLSSVLDEFGEYFEEGAGDTGTSSGQ